jgi:hypothetical protein
LSLTGTVPSRSTAVLCSSKCTPQWVKGREACGPNWNGNWLIPPQALLSVALFATLFLSALCLPSKMSSSFCCHIHGVNGFVLMLFFAQNVLMVSAFSEQAGVWTTSELSASRSRLTATSLPFQHLAIFAGGQAGDLIAPAPCNCAAHSHSLVFHSLVSCPAASVSTVYSTVDILDVSSGLWSTAALSVARCQLASTSLPNHGLAFFAGGFNGGISFTAFLNAVFLLILKHDV